MTSKKLMYLHHNFIARNRKMFCYIIYKINNYVYSVWGAVQIILLIRHYPILYQQVQKHVTPD